MNDFKHKYMFLYGGPTHLVRAFISIESIHFKETENAELVNREDERSLTSFPYSCVSIRLHGPNLYIKILLHLTFQTTDNIQFTLPKSLSHSH